VPVVEQSSEQSSAVAAALEATASDEQIVERVLRGELGLFGQLIRRHNARVYRAARAILNDDSEAEDVTQDAYVRAYEHLGAFEGRARFCTWLTRIAVHEALARARRGRRFAPLDAETQEASCMPTRSPRTPEQHASDHELRALLEDAVICLPECFRTVFVLRELEGMSCAETAECLGIPEATVKTRLHRARAACRRHGPPRSCARAAGDYLPHR